jgi:hypothetical protein
MKRLITLAVAGGALMAMAACGDDGTPAAVPSNIASAAASAAADAGASSKAACTTADTIYANLDATTKAEIAKGIAAAAAGNTEEAKKALDQVAPILKAASVTFQSESDKAVDPNLKTTLKALSDQYLQASQVTSAADLSKIDLTKSQATLKSLCSQAGVQLQHLP